MEPSDNPKTPEIPETTESSETSNIPDSQTSQETKESEETGIFQCPVGHTIYAKSGFCMECSPCFICGKTLTPQEYFQYQRWHWKADNKNRPWEPSHSSCWTEQEKAIARTETVTIPKALYERMNLYLGLVEGSTTDSDITNRSQAQIAVARLYSQVWSNFETAHVALQRMEEACIQLHLLIKDHRIEIQEKRDEKQKAKFEETTKYRQQHNMTIADKIAIKDKQRTEKKEGKRLSKQEGWLSKEGLTAEEIQATLDATKAIREQQRKERLEAKKEEKVN